MKIGDKVKFLSETGGGRIAGFKGNNIVLVEDEDGFQIPTPISDVVVTGTDDEYQISNVVKSITKKQNERSSASVKAKLNDFDDDAPEEEDDPSDKEVSFKREAEERKGGNALNCYLAFVPVDIKDFSNTRFECYFVNDSNYYVKYNYLFADGVTWTLHSDGEIEPNTKEFIEEFGHEDLNNFDRVAVQMIACKHDKNFVLKHAIDVQLRLEPIKFYKLHSFVANEFFESPALLCPIVENDKVARTLAIDAKKLKQEMYGNTAQAPSATQQSQSNDGSYVRRYESNGKKGNPFISGHNKKDDVLVVDLHANELLETTAGMGAADILNYQIEQFRKVLDQHKDEKGKRIIFIHGKGEGVLRHAIMNDLKYRYKKYSYQDASFQEYGYGATQITIR